MITVLGSTHAFEICCQNQNRFIIIPFTTFHFSGLMKVSISSLHFFVSSELWQLLAMSSDFADSINLIFFQLINLLINKGLLKNLSKYNVQYVSLNLPGNFIATLSYRSLLHSSPLHFSFVKDKSRIHTSNHLNFHNFHLNFQDPFSWFQFYVLL